MENTIVYVMKKGDDVHVACCHKARDVKIKDGFELLLAIDLANVTNMDQAFKSLVEVGVSEEEWWRAMNGYQLCDTEALKDTDVN